MHSAGGPDTGSGVATKRNAGTRKEQDTMTDEQQQEQQQGEQQEQQQEQQRPNQDQHRDGQRSPDEFLKQFDALAETVNAMPDKIVDALRQAGASQQQQQQAKNAAEQATGQQQTEQPKKKTFGDWWFGS